MNGPSIILILIHPAIDMSTETEPNTEEGSSLDEVIAKVKEIDNAKGT